MRGFSEGITQRLVPTAVKLVCVALAVSGLAGWASATPGDVLVTVIEPEPMISCCGIGVEYDGSRILYTHVDDRRIHFTDLSGGDLGELVLLDPAGGGFTGDCCNAIAFRWGTSYLYGGGWDTTNLYQVDMNTGIVTLVKANAVPPGPGFIDGLAWDPTTNTFWMSDDVACNVEHLDINGNDIGGFDGCALTGHGNSGLAVGLEGTLFYATASVGLIYYLDTSTDPPTNLGVFSHTYGRDEDMTCGPRYTKANNTVVTTLLAQDAYDNFFTVVEMAPGKCLVPGDLIDLAVSPPDLAFVPSGPFPFDSVVSLEATAHNLGELDAVDVPVRFYDGPPAGSNAINGDQAIAFIPKSGGTGQASVSWNARPQGAHEICVVLDPDHRIPETNEGNNQACRSVDVLPTKPVTSLFVGQPNYTAAMTYITSATPLTLSVVDPGGAGIRTTRYWIDTGPWNDYAGPFTLLREGEQVVEWYSEDNLGNVEAPHLVYLRVDNTPPTSTPTVGSPKYLVGGTFVTSATPLSLDATDGGVTPVGVESTEYLIDAGPWAPYSGPFSLSGDGPHEVGMQSRDLLGNVEIPVMMDIVVDDLPPTTTISPTGGQVSDETEFTLSATDAGSGVAGSEYRIDGGTWIAYGSAFVVPGGSHRIWYRSVDNLGNLEAERSIDIWVEPTLPPITVLLIGDPQWDAPPIFITSATPLTLSAIDRSTFGLRHTMYRVDGRFWLNYSAIGPFTLADEGDHVIEWYSEDLAGNVEVPGSAVLYVDNTPPTTTPEVGEPNYDAGGIFVTSRSPVSLRAEDGGVIPVGLAYLEYRIGGGSWAPYAGAFMVSAPDGAKRIEFAAADHLGNRATGILDLVLDDTPPVTTISPTDGRASPDTTFRLAATDGGSGVARSEFRIDGGPWTLYGDGFRLAVGDHIIGYRSADHLNNTEPENTLAVFVTTPLAPVATNWKPLLAGILAAILIAAGASSASRRSRLEEQARHGAIRAFAIETLPLAAAEIATGVISYLTGWLSIPPLAGLGTAVDIAILVAGLVILVAQASRASRVAAT